MSNHTSHTFHVQTHSDFYGALVTKLSRAVCQCGWRGMSWSTRELALESGRQHAERMAQADARGAHGAGGRVVKNYRVTVVQSGSGREYLIGRCASLPEALRLVRKLEDRFLNNSSIMDEDDPLQAWEGGDVYCEDDETRVVWTLSEDFAWERREP